VEARALRDASGNEEPPANIERQIALERVCAVTILARWQLQRKLEDGDFREAKVR
jgi:hypothetical protein